MTIQRDNDKSRIVGDRGNVRSPKEIFRLRERVLLERLEGLQAILLRRLWDAELGEVDDVNCMPLEKTAKFSKLPGASRCEQQLPSQLPNAPICAASSSRIPRTARSTSLSS